MEIGIALPTMATGFSRGTFTEWCRGIDEGPYSSVSAGERITFHNPELLVTTTAAAALTERVQVITNIAVLPLHRPALLAKQLATLDVLASGRLQVGVGVGGREQDYRALDVPFDGRHERLDASVAELRRLWAGGPAYAGGQPVGPAPHTPGGPPLLAGHGPEGDGPRRPVGGRRDRVLHRRRSRGDRPGQLDGPRRVGGRGADGPAPPRQRLVLPARRFRRRPFFSLRSAG